MEAQVCGALPVASTNTVQLTYDGAGDNLSSYLSGLNYGRRLGAPLSWLNSSAIHVGGAVLGADEVLMRRLNAVYSVAATRVAGSTAAVCLSSGVDFRRDDWRDVDLSFSYVDVPLVATVSAPLRVSERITVSPFVAPAVHAYSANISGSYIAGLPDGWEWQEVEHDEKGFDFSAAAGASLIVGRFSVVGAYQTGYMMFGDLDRAIVRLGFHF